MKPLHTLLQHHQPLFTKELGEIHPLTASLHAKPDALPRFFKPHPVLFAIKDAISRELKRLEKQGTISPVTHSNWATPIVPVPKKDGKFCICEITVNQVLAVEYPLLTPEKLFLTLSGGKIFSKLGLSQAYLQLPVQKEPKPYLTITTHEGLYVYNSLPFGVASAPVIFQKLMDKVLQGISGVICHIDDILICSADEETHLSPLEKVFSRLETHGFQLKLKTFEFLLTCIEYLGHIITGDGIKPVPSKVEAIVKASKSVNVQQLRSFLGLINHYGKFIPSLSTLLHPLNALQAHKKWVWSSECAKAFQTAKNQSTSAVVLTHYDPSLPITLAAHASAYGVGAVISHVFPDSSERPIAFVSFTLSSSKQNYAQLQKETLALIFWCKSSIDIFMALITTNHNLGTQKSIPSLVTVRLQRRAILLSVYDYNIH